MLLIELNYRFIAFKIALAETQPSGLDFSKLAVFNNVDYLMNMYRASEIGTNIMEKIIDSNIGLIDAMQVTRIVELCLYCLLGLWGSYLISTLKKSTTE